MSIFDTSAQAGALCAIIALGFMDIAKDQSYIVFHDGKDDAGEDARHEQLRKKLANLGVNISFQTQSSSDKPLQPVILGRTGREKLQGDVVGDIRDLMNRLEKEVNSGKHIPLRGAYIGGLLSADCKAELLDPSILYCYAPGYREFTPEVEASYQNALEVTQAVQDFLQTEFKDGSRQKKRGSLLYQADPRPISTAAPKSTENKKLFGSVHGMTQSIIHYAGNADTSKVNMELALSADTCKVASCIPCSIFMWANGTPASAAHFGRGDNWNFPSAIFERIQMCSGPDQLEPLAGYPLCVKSWMEAVWKSYDAGKACLEKVSQTVLLEDLKHAIQLDRNQIPRMFLEALTFEGPFLSKMLNVLPEI